MVDVGVEGREGRAAHTKVTAFTAQLSPTEPNGKCELQVSQAFLLLQRRDSPRRLKQTQNPQGPPANRWRGTAHASSRRPCSRPAHQPGPSCRRPGHQRSRREGDRGTDTPRGGARAPSPDTPAPAPRPPSRPGLRDVPAPEQQRGERLRRTGPARAPMPWAGRGARVGGRGKKPPGGGGAVKSLGESCFFRDCCQAAGTLRAKPASEGGDPPCGSQGRCAQDAQGELPGPWGPMALYCNDSFKEQESTRLGEEKGH